MEAKPFLWVQNHTTLPRYSCLRRVFPGPFQSRFPKAYSLDMDKAASRCQVGFDRFQQGVVQKRKDVWFVCSPKASSLVSPIFKVELSPKASRLTPERCLCRAFSWNAHGHRGISASGCVCVCVCVCLKLGPGKQMGVPNKTSHPCAEPGQRWLFRTKCRLPSKSLNSQLLLKGASKRHEPRLCLRSPLEIRGWF